ncbi:COX15/CtaA family protein [Rubeoparvulum massiliense]|uniref:COX15/CtaA family protein n=1 Tax=Rubeoparvulum massiliense TaxID=1631346 RepID=UPI00065E3963|nr:COX15/CtaA family protein [Rubeoparvulum massiliense]
MRHRFSLFTTIFTIVVLALGNLVVATGAGEACGSDWPRCNGSYIPDLTDPLVMIEYIHRLGVAVLGFLILANAILAWRRREPHEKSIGQLALASLVLLLTQALVGGLNTMLGTPAGFSTLDVVISLALLSSLVWLTVALKRPQLDGIPERVWHLRKPYRRAAVTFFLALYGEIFLGAFFKHSRASHLHFGVPYDRILFESSQLAEVLYLIHGMFAVALLVSAGYLIFYEKQLGYSRRLSYLMFTLVGIDTLLGIISSTTQLAVFVSSMHMLFASLSLLISGWIVGTAVYTERRLQIGADRASG